MTETDVPGLDTPAVAQPMFIDVGAHDGDAGNSFRLWRAREALRQGEIRVVGEMASVVAMMTRASSALGWSITLAFALTAAGVAVHAWLASAGSVSCLLAAAAMFLSVLWRRFWGVPGDDPDWVMAEPLSSELEVTEALAKRVKEASNRNVNGIKKLSRRFRFGSLFMVLSVAWTLTWMVWGQASALARVVFPMVSGWVVAVSG